MSPSFMRGFPLFTLGLIASPALAEAPKPGEMAQAATARRAAEAGTEQAGRVLSQGSPNSRATAGFSASNIQFAQDGDETSVSVAFSIDLTSYRRPTERDDYYGFRQSKLTLVASTPIESGSKDASLFSGDSLVSGSKLKLSYSSFSTRVGTGKGGDAEISSAYRTCVARNAQRWVEAQPERAGAAITAAGFVASLNDKLSWRGTSVNYDGIMVATAASGDLGLLVAEACYPGQDNGALSDEYDLVSTYGEDKLSFGRRFLPDNAKLTFWGLDASMGRDDHNFLDRTAFKLDTKPRTSWEVGAYAGWINSDLTFSLRGRIVFGQSYKDQDEAEICRTVSIPAGQECLTGPDGEPLRMRTGLFSLEARKMVTLKDGTNIAIAPQLTYRFEDKNVGVEVPLYLTSDKEGKLSGGIKAVYNSKGDEFAVGLFVGVPFSVFY